RGLVVRSPARGAAHPDVVIDVRVGQETVGGRTKPGDGGRLRKRGRLLSRRLPRAGSLSLARRQGARGREEEGRFRRGTHRRECNLGANGAPGVPVRIRQGNSAWPYRKRSGNTRFPSRSESAGSGPSSRGEIRSSNGPWRSK